MVTWVTYVLFPFRFIWVIVSISRGIWPKLLRFYGESAFQMRTTRLIPFMGCMRSLPLFKTIPTVFRLVKIQFRTSIKSKLPCFYVNLPLSLPQKLQLYGGAAYYCYETNCWLWRWCFCVSAITKGVRTLWEHGLQSLRFDTCSLNTSSFT